MHIGSFEPMVMFFGMTNSPATCKKAKLQAGIKLTALCSAIDKENSIESLLDSATLYIQLLLWLCTLPPTVLMPVS